MLHVTNGDSTVEGLRQAPVVGDIVAWRDVLHEGPVPALSAAELRTVRARFLDGPTAAVEADLRARDERLGAALAAEERVVLWFEHDLYDQLQLLQILAGLPDRPVGVELICVGSFPGRPSFAGLGELEPDELASLWPVRTPVVNEHVRAARAGLGCLPRARPTRARPRGHLAGRAAAVRRAGAAAAAGGAAGRPRRPLPHGAPAAGRRRRGRPHARAGVPRCRRVRGGTIPRRHGRVRPPRRPRPRPAPAGQRSARAHRAGRRGARRPRRPRRAQRLRPLARRHPPAGRRRAVALGRRAGLPRRPLTR